VKIGFIDLPFALFAEKTKHAIQRRFCICSLLCQPTVCVTCVWAGVDSAWEQEKLEARKMLENAAESHTSGARFVGQCLIFTITMCF